MKHYLHTVEEVFADIKSCENGITEAEAQKRLEANGKNKLAEGKNVILEIEVQGAMNIKKQISDAVMIFVICNVVCHKEVVIILVISTGDDVCLSCCRVVICIYKSVACYVTVNNEGS